MKSKNWLRNLAILVLLSLFPAASALAQSIYASWFNTCGGTVPGIVLGAAVDDGTNVNVLGRFYGPTYQVGTTTLTNWLATSNLFLFQFKGSSTNPPIWAEAAITEYPVSNGRICGDFSGNIFVAGSYGGTNLIFGTTGITNYNTDHSEDVFLARFATSGSVTWLKHIGGTAEDSLGDMALDPAISPSGFYVTGSFLSPAFTAGGTTLTRQNPGGSDSYAAKFGLNGNLLWMSQGTYSTGDYIAVDTANNCYVGGTVSGAATFGGTSPMNQTTTNYVVKYNSAGTPVWVRGDVVLGTHLAVDNVQCLYTAGTFSNVLQVGSTTLSNNSTATIFVAKYDASGNPLWAQQLPGLGYDGCTSVWIDRLANCWVTGYFAATNQTPPLMNSTAVLACFDASGDLLALSQGGGSPSSTVAGMTADAFLSNLIAFGNYATNFSFANKYTVTNTGNADIFASIVALAPKVATTTHGTNMVLSWPAITENKGFVLQAITNFGSTNWVTVGSAANVNGQYMITNAMTNTARFYRLVR